MDVPFSLQVSVANFFFSFVAILKQVDRYHNSKIEFRPHKTAKAIVSYLNHLVNMIASRF